MTPRADRKLAAIVAVDVVGYSRLVGIDEAGTLARVKAHRIDLAEPLIAEHNGRIVKLTGDGALVEFESAVDAVECAVAIQTEMATREAGEPEDRKIRYRIGINIGDIVHDDDDIFGDGVNIAARIESLAEPGGVAIARNVHDQVKAKLDLEFAPMGAHQVKNIAEPVEVWRVELDGAVPRTRAPSTPTRWRAVAAVAAALAAIAAGGATWWYVGSPPAEMIAETATDPQPAPPLPEKPSIAVLPFDNLSGVERFERLADGLTEDIITDLSRFRDLFVIARNSTFFYKDKPTDVRQIARELGVQYVLEGSLQAQDGQIRITGQLIDAGSGNHLWSERYDRPLDDVFAIQDEVTEQIVATIAGHHGVLARFTRETSRANAPGRLRASHYYFLGMEAKHKFTMADNLRAQELFKQALELDPTHALAYIGRAWSVENQIFFGWNESWAESMKQFKSYADKAIALDSSNGES